MQTKHAEGVASNLFKVSLAYVHWLHKIKYEFSHAVVHEDGYP